MYGATVRRVVGWQFREHGGETKVWYQRRWRDLIQSRPDFQGVRVDADGWIMPVLSSRLNDNQQKKKK